MPIWSYDNLVHTETKKTNLDMAQQRLKGQTLQKRTRQFAPGTVQNKTALTTPQSSIWLDWATDENCAKYNICNIVQFEGDLDIAALHKAIVQTDAENDALRLRFDTKDGDVFQTFADTSHNTEFSVIDFSYDENPERAANHEVEETRARPLDPINGYHCRHRLFKLGKDRFWWVRVYHHLVCDGYAGHLMAHRTAEIYSALVSGAPVPETTFGSYGDFIASDADYPQSAASARDLAYWQERLKNDPAITRFSSHIPTQKPPIAYQAQCLDGPELTKLTETAKACGTSPTSVMMAVYFILLGQIAQTKQPTAILPLLNRTGRVERNTPGTFSCTIPFDVDLDKHTCFSELARDIFARARRDVRHIRLAPVRMRAARLGAQGLSGSGAFFNSLDAPEPLAFTGLSTRRINVYNGPVNDLGLIHQKQAITPDHHEAELIWQFNTDCFDPKTVTRIANRFRQFLAKAMDNPNQEIAAITVLANSELDDLRGIETAPAIDDTTSDKRLMPARIDDAIAARPDQIALIDQDGRKTTFATLGRMANAVARYLQQQGVKRGDFVGMNVASGPQQIAAVIGMMKCGATCVQLDPLHPVARNAEMTRHLGCQLILSSTAAAWKSIVNTAFSVVDIATLPGIDGQTDGTNIHVDVNGDDIAFVFHTSGSTGQPKPVPVLHQSLKDKVNFIITRLGIGSHEAGTPEIMGLFPSIGFDPWMAQFCIGLTRGHSMWLMTHATLADAHKFWGGIVHHKVTHLMSVPSLYESLIDAVPTDAQFHLRRLVTGGEVMPPKLVTRLYAIFDTADIWNCYGPTEATIHIACHRIPNNTTAKTIALGPVDHGVIVRILGDDENRVPLGIPGELYIGGAGLNPGYINMPVITAQMFIPDPTGETDQIFYRSGDCVSWGEDGQLYFHGRYDEQIKIRGQRIEIGEVEYHLSRITGVGQAAVLYVKTNHGGDLLAYITPDKTHSTRPDIDTIRTELARHLSNAAIPSRIEWAEVLPVLPSGKVDRQALAALARTPILSSPAANQPLAKIPRQPDQIRIQKLAVKIGEIWANLIETDAIEFDANLFEAGAHSLLVPRAQFAFSKLVGRNIPSIDIFQYPTINSFARHLCDDDLTPTTAAQRQTLPTPPLLASNRPDEHDIAIIGMAMRLPGADDPDTFWAMLENGIDHIRDVDIARLRNMGGDPAALEDPNFVPRHGILDNIDMFDPAPFAMTAGGAIETDPQQRLLLEVALNALEDGSCDPARDGPVGAYVGVGFPTYLVDVLGDRLHPRPDAMRYGLAIGNDKDFAATRLAYKLDLTGPAIASATACSTGLVNIVLAAQALRAGQCRVALAGGASLGISPAGGYYFTEGGIGSRSGVCRPFDHHADGVVGGSGAAIVVLKRLNDAIHDRDTIHGVIKGVGLSNDGADKAAFSAPTVDGQANAITSALTDAQIDPSSIQFVEGHGTGTALGDPIEVAALNRAFAKTDRNRAAPIWLGSVKGNIGHLDAAAGVTGLIKAVLALKHRSMPPTCHFDQPNENLALDQGPFDINKTTQPLHRTGNNPLRAGVSSFGVGGTNAHVIVEEAPAPHTADDDQASDDLSGTQTPYVLPFSAASETALQNVLANTADWLARDPSNIAIPDLANSLSRRRAYRFRTAIIASDIPTVIAALGDAKSPHRQHAIAQRSTPAVTLLFPGQGSQRPGMAADLYHADTLSAELITDACQQVTQMGGPDDLLHLLISDDTPSADAPSDAKTRLAKTEIAQPALFIFEYALARFLMRGGVAPAALAGHSIGEYVAACIGGVMAFDDALALVVMRGRLMGQTQPGSMFALSMTEAEVGDLLSAFGPDLSMAAINGPRQCVVAGSHVCIDALEDQIKQQGNAGRRLIVSHAFHSPMMEPILDAFRDLVAGVPLHAPTIPIQSNLTGKWLSPTDATSPDYWAQHLRNAVRFADNIKELLADMPETMMVECGFGNTASRLAIVNGTNTQNSIACQPAPRPNQPPDGANALAQTLAKLWTHGVSPDWENINRTQKANRIPVPGYAFDRRRFWPEAPARTPTAPQSTDDINFAAPAPKTSNAAVIKPTDTPPVSDNPLLATILEIWRDMFGEPALSPRDDFFELGGDSLFAVRIAARLSEELSAEIPAAILFEGRTVTGVADLLARHIRPQESPPSSPPQNIPSREQGVL